MTTILAVDYSAVAMTVIKRTADEADGTRHDSIVRRIERHAEDYDAVILCLDAKTSWRKEAYPEYKAQRPPRSIDESNLMRRAYKTLRAKGYPALVAEGYEGDDIIASVVAWAYNEDVTVDILGCDKDLWQLLEHARFIISHSELDRETGEPMRRNAAWLQETHGIEPYQVPDWLALMGDKSDNIPGIDGCGPVLAAQLLYEFGDVVELGRVLRENHSALDAVQGLGTKRRHALFAAYWDESDEPRTDSPLQMRGLTKLRTDAPIKVGDALGIRVPTVEHDSEPPHERATDIPPPEESRPQPKEAATMEERDSSPEWRDPPPAPTGDMILSRECDQIAMALALAQGKMGTVTKDKVAEVRSKKEGVKPYQYNYADLGSVLKTVIPAFAAEGIAVLQMPGGKMLVTMLVHKSGQWVRCMTPIVANGGGPQAYGSAVSYARRYALVALSGVPQEDDDAAQAQSRYNGRRSA